jgi:hypothetical protein
MGPEFFQTSMGHKFFESTMPGLVKAVEEQVRATKRLADAVEENNKLLRRSRDKGEPSERTGFVIFFSNPHKESEGALDHYWRASDKQMQPDLTEATVYPTEAEADVRVSEILDLINRGERHLIRLDFPKVMYLMNGELFYPPTPA